METEKLAKLPNVWEKNLIAFVNANLGSAFVWGKNDCTSFTRDCIRAMCGHFDGPKITYKTHAGALRFIKRTGFDPEKWLLENTICEYVKPNYYQVGDIAIIDRDGFKCCHIILGSNTACVWPDNGVALGKTKELPPDTIVIRIL